MRMLLLSYLATLIIFKASFATAQFQSQTIDANEQTNWQDVTPIVESAIEFWSDWLRESTTRTADKKAVKDIIRAISYIESRHGTKTGNYFDNDPMQIADPNSFPYFNIGNNPSKDPYHALIREGDLPVYSWKEIPTVVSLDPNLPNIFNPINLPENGHADAGFNMEDSYFWGIGWFFFCVQTAQGCPLNGGWRLGNGDFDTLFLGAVKYNDGVDPDYESKIRTFLDSTETSDAWGDPHFHTFRGKKFRYDGECDLVFMKSDSFSQGSGLHVHIRTQRGNRAADGHLTAGGSALESNENASLHGNGYSFISTFAAKIGSDIVEIDHNGFVYVNSESVLLSNDERMLYLGFNLYKSRGPVYYIDLGPQSGEWLEVIRDAGHSGGFLHVIMHGYIDDSEGLVGHANQAGFFGRDGSTQFHNKTQFSEEWQVGSNAGDPILFHAARYPQYPAPCQYY